MIKIERQGNIITAGELSLAILPIPAPSLQQQAEIRRSGWIPQGRDFSGEQVAEELQADMIRWQRMGLPLRLRQADGCLEIDLTCPPAGSYTIKRDGLEVQ